MTETATTVKKPVLAEYMLAGAHQKLELTLDYEHCAVYVGYRHESDNATRMKVWENHASDVTLSPNGVTKETLEELLEQLYPLVERAHAGYETRWDGIVVYDADAQEALSAIDDAIRVWDENTTGMYLHPETYYQDRFSGCDCPYPEALTGSTTDEEMAAMILDEIAQCWSDCARRMEPDEVEEYLQRGRDKMAQCADSDDQ
jgi:hypothetical protein